MKPSPRRQKMIDEKWEKIARESVLVGLKPRKLTYRELMKRKMEEFEYWMINRQFI